MSFFFEQLANDLKKVDVNSILHDIFKENDLSKWVADTIQNRLYTKGDDAKGFHLRTDKSIEEGLGNVYAYSTINETKPNGRFRGKKQRHQKYTNVTLSSDGKFYLSLKAVLNLYGFEVDANFLKPKGRDIFDNFKQSYASKQKFYEAISGLSEYELKQLFEQKVIPKIKQKLNEII